MEDGIEYPDAYVVAMRRAVDAFGLRAMVCPNLLYYSHA